MVYRSLLRPMLFRLSPETAHELALSSLSFFLAAAPIRKAVAGRHADWPLGAINRFGLEFTNPIGLAAGFDKNGTAAQGLAALGFGFIEVGTVTSEPQSGNERPRLFRLPSDQALINRLGFNNCGAPQLAENVRRHPPDCVLGVNIGKSRTVVIPDAISDYLASFNAVYDVADYIAINVSSPNTPHLRELQRREPLGELLTALQKRNDEFAKDRHLESGKPLLLKIAPDLSEAELEAIIDVGLQASVAGIIATNTTVSRDNLRASPADIQAYGPGGLSGAPLRNRSNQIISIIHRLTRGHLPIIGVGGVFTAQDAWEKICAGASLVQLYTGFIYEGPRVANKINDGLAAIVSREGFKSLDEAIGCDLK
ncbi:MAG: quinone-dependent dihydroorotate dehydrogenase [Pyrinomonadaceae bacterium]